MTFLRRSLSALASLMLIAAAAVAFTLPAEARSISTKVCDSVDSPDHSPIFVWIINGGPGYLVDYGTCAPWLGNSSDQIRVDTCPPQGNGSSGYWIKPEGGSYGPRHDGCNSNSNPPDVDGKIWYKLDH